MTPPPPAISVVIPTYDRPDRLAACLDGLALQRPSPAGFEIVIVDDGSPRPVQDVVDRYRSRLQVMVHRQANAGPARARNVGAERAGGDLLAFIDDDCVPAAGWLDGLAAAARTNPGALIGGTTRNALSSDRYAESSQLLGDHVCGHDRGGPRFFPSNNIAVPAPGFAAIGGFDPEFPHAAGEDRDFCDRWLTSGRTMIHAPKAIVLHHHAFTMRTFWRQHHNYGRGAYRFQRARTNRTGDGIRIEPPSFYTSMLTRPFRVAPTRRAMVLSGLIVVSQVANAAGYARERAEHARRHRGVSPA